jgi:NAD+ diphosphatase
VLNHPIGTRFGSAEYKKMAEHTEGRNNQDATTTEDLMIEGPPFKLPPVTAIAGVLIKDWAEGNIGFPSHNGGPTQPLQRGNL